MGVDIVALAAALARPAGDVVLSGAVTVAQLPSNAAARDLAAVLATDGLVEPEDANRYWAARSALGWG